MRAVVLLVTALCFTTLAPALPADEGMWLFNDLPRELLMQRHGFAPDAKWTDHLMRSSVRFNSGGS
ncbi:MAG: S46 family peptidase, partial [Planctomycetaceae bacterium]